MKCKNCGHKLRINPFSDIGEWMHYSLVEKEGKKMNCYCIKCECGCIKPIPRK